MIVSNPVVWAMSALSIMTVITFVYFAVIFMLLYITAWAILQFWVPVMKFLTYGR